TVTILRRRVGTKHVLHGISDWNRLLMPVGRWPGIRAAPGQARDRQEKTQDLPKIAEDSRVLPLRSHFCSGGKTLISTRRFSALLLGWAGSAGTSQPFPSMLNLLGSNLYLSISARLMASARARLRSLTACTGTLPFMLESAWPSIRITARAN